MKIILGRTFKWLVMLPAAAILLHCRITPAQQQGRFTISFGTQNEFVKELPIVARLTFSIPRPDQEAGAPTPTGVRPFLYAPLTTLFSDSANIRVLFKQQETGIEYSIRSTRGHNMTVSGPAGSMSSGELLYYVPVVEGDSRTMLMDLSSLRHEAGNGQSLSHIPAGRYNVRMEVPGSELKSNTVSINLRPALPQELQLAQQVAEATNRKAPQANPNWSQALKVAPKVVEILSSTSVSNVGGEGAEQLSFHAFIVALLSLKDYRGDRVLLEQMHVPTYLAADKESLLFETDIVLSHQETAEYKEKVDQFMRIHPDLKWRIFEARAGEAEFAPYLPAVKAK